MEIEASDIEHALQLALEGMAAGKWDLFRGQTNSDWNVTSSAERVSEAERQQALEKFKRFVGWAQNVEQMSRYFSAGDSFWAIAQHYGLLTTFIDFTDDPHVAGFFACDAKSAPPVGQQACIVCVNSNDFAEFWRQLGPSFGLDEAHYPSFLRIDVDNLWRLQRQKGSFLWNPITDIERFCVFDRIVFPYVSSHSKLPARSEIYPLHQSELEKLLTQFFMNEQMLEGALSLAELNTLTFSIKGVDDQYQAESWCPSGIEVSSDWKQSEDWQVSLVEHSNLVLPSVLVAVPDGDHLEKMCAFLRLTLDARFVEENRRRTLDITIPYSSADAMRLIRRIRRLWNGMRTLPYTPSEVSTAIAHTLDLFQSADMSDPRRAYGERSLYIEMASNSDGCGAYSRATITESAFIGASNPAFLVKARKKLEEAGPRSKSEEDLARSYLQLPARPWERFTFSGLRTLMVEQIIPTQIVWRVSSEEAEIRTAVYFSPKDFKVFGLP